VAKPLSTLGSADQARVAYDALLGKTGLACVTSLVGFAVEDLFDRLLLTLGRRLGEHDAIERHAEAALAVAARLGSPVWEAHVRADLADALDSRGRPGDAARAAEERSRARVVAERLDMPGLLERVRAGEEPDPPDPGTARRERPSTGGAVRVVHEGELWLVTGFGETVRVSGSRGIEMLARLVSEPRRELHALDLAGATEAVAWTDAGAALDPVARAAYRARLAELVADRDDAEARGDLGAAERANAEMEALTSELERAVGLGGRDRKVGAPSERARSNVKRRLQHAIEQIAKGSPRLGEHFTATVRTGTYCVYEPG
jgi:hypothetical protein